MWVRYKTSFTNNSFRVLSLLGLLLCVLPADSSPTPSDAIVLTSNQNEFPIETSAEYLLIDKTVSAEDISSPQYQLLWKPYHGAGLPRSSINTQLWLRFALKNQDANTNWRLTLAWPILEHAQLSTFNNDTAQWWHSRPVGDYYPMADRYVQHRFLLFPLFLKQQQPLTYYLNIRSTNLLAVPVSIRQVDDLVAQTQIDLLILGGLFGGLLIMLMYNLCLYVLLKDSTYLYYCLYVGSVILYQVSATGFGTYLFWDSSLWLKQYSFMLTSILTFITAVIFGRYFLKLPTHGGWLLKGNNFLLILWLVIGLAGIAGFARLIIAVTGLASFITCIIGTATAIVLWRRNFPAAKMFAIAWGTLIIGTVIFVMALEGLLPVNSLTRNSQMIGFVVELILLSVALAHRINHEIEERQQAQSDALMLTKKVSEERRERLKAQMETLSVQRQLNEELEVHVTERTEQLNDAMEKLENANAELTKLSVTDPLTKVHNRRYFDDTLIDEYKRAIRMQQYLAIVVVDIDYFKSINDNYGHIVGDHCISLVANTLKQSINRPGDLVARYGGEEFVYILPGSDEEDALVVAERCRRAVEGIDYHIDNEKVSLTVSAGIAAWIPTEEGAYKQLINAADTALYRAKNAGRNCVMTASERGKLAQI